MSSNITLRSNVYINQSAQRDDKQFLQHITDYRVLKRYKASSYGFQSNMSWMTPVQLEILRQGQPNCSLEKGTMSWGVPVGGDRMLCRCEQYDCSRFPICSQYPNYSPVTRTPEDKVTEESEATTPLGLYVPQPAIVDETQNVPEIAHEVESGEVVLPSEEPVVKAEAEEIQSSEKAEEATEEVAADETMWPEEPEQNVPEAPAIVVQPEQRKNTERKIVSQETIINADMHDRVWVNAGPGTGKTYTVIQRLKKLLNDDVDGTILVLCFSRNAVQVIRERLTDALGPAAASLIDDGQLVIRTFDSFATYMLEDELNPTWDYNQRIEAFIKMIGNNPGSLNDMLGYLIVDEIQDTVGARARMLLSILDEIKCGVLLLGDSCQAIFDWTIRDTDDMTFHSLAAHLDDRQFKIYELADNRRQSAELAEVGAKLRDKILHSTEEEQEEAVNHFKHWASQKWKSYSVKVLPQELNGGADLVLCKTNGEAAHVSQILFETPPNIEHTMKQSSSHRSLASWIAKVLNENDGSFLSKEDFIKNAEEYEVDDPEEKWKALKSLDGHPHASVLHIKEILAALSKMDGLPAVCLNQSNNRIVISTVHRAKGSEAEHVYWLDSPLVYDGQQNQDGALSDSIKAAYVAATRAKKDIHILSQDKGFYMRSVNETRWIQIGYSKSKKPYCKGIAFIPGDVDNASFVSLENAENAQTVLSVLEPGMPVTLYPDESNGCFEIYFDGLKIGNTSLDFTMALFAGFEATNHNKNWPSKIPDVYITAVTTVVMPEASEIDPQYRTSGCWLGIELGGFPTIEWY